MFYKHARFLNRYRLHVNEETKCLPHIYWLPKVHKNPRKARTIKAASKFSLKPVSKFLAAVFKILFLQIESCNNQLSYCSEINTFWIILNNQPAIKSIANINVRTTAASISFFNFSTLRTNISHNKLSKVLCEITEFSFKANKGDFIIVDKYAA